MKSRLLPLLIFPLAWSAAPAPAQDYFCYMVNPAGQTIDLGQLCGVPGSQPPGPVAPASPASGPVEGAPEIVGNELVRAALEIRQDRQQWVISGAVGNTSASPISVVSVPFGLFDADGRLTYQGVIVPQLGPLRILPGRSRDISMRVPMSQVLGTPTTATPAEIRYTR